MSKLSETLKKENVPRETPAQKRTVRLVKMGAFLRAYDRSAWLLKRSGSPLNAGLDKGDGSSHIFVGFPVSSADKFAPEGSEAIKDGDGVISEWILSPTKFPPEESYELLDGEYDKWSGDTLAELESQQQEKKQKKGCCQTSAPFPDRTALSGRMCQIYPECPERTAGSSIGWCFEDILSKLRIHKQKFIGSLSFGVFREKKPQAVLRSHCVRGVVSIRGCCFREISCMPACCGLPQLLQWR